MAENRLYTQLLVNYYLEHPEMFDSIDLERRAYITDDAYDQISKHMEKTYGKLYVIDRVKKGTLGGKYAKSLKDAKDLNTMTEHMHDALNAVAKGIGAVGLGVAGLTVLPTVIPAVANAYASYVPAGVKSAVDGYVAYKAAEHMASEDGVKKTVKHFKNGETAKGVISLAGDVLDATGVVGGSVQAVRNVREIPKEINRLLELLIRYKGNTKNAIQTPISMTTGLASNPLLNLKAVVTGDELARVAAILGSRSLRWHGTKPTLMEKGTHYNAKAPVSKRGRAEYKDFINPYKGEKDLIYYKTHPEEYNALKDGAIIDDSWAVVDLKLHPEFNTPELLRIFEAKGIKDPSKVLVPKSSNPQSLMHNFKKFMKRQDKEMVGSHSDIQSGGRVINDTDGVDTMITFSKNGNPSKVDIDVLDYSDPIIEGFKLGLKPGLRNLGLHILDFGNVKPVLMSNVIKPSTTRLEEYMLKLPNRKELATRFTRDVNTNMLAHANRRDPYYRHFVFNPNYKLNEDAMMDMFDVWGQSRNPFSYKGATLPAREKYLVQLYSKDLQFNGNTALAEANFKNRENVLRRLFGKWKKENNK